MTVKEFREEISNKERFEFGKNWKRFLTVLNEERINAAENSLKEMLGLDSLEGKTFLDIGSGSGLFSLAARNLGAKVTSFDFDDSSVGCTAELKKRFYSEDNNWEVMQGSVLDNTFLNTLGTFDFVYSWGVLHHTGNMWEALKNVVSLVKDDGVLFIALYNYQKFFSRYWTFVKKTYNKFLISRPLLILVHGLYPTLPSVALKILQQRKAPRGMTIWYDLLDWLGGYPFEVSTPKDIFNFYKSQGFVLTQINTVFGNSGCNEFVFRRETLKK